MNVYQYNNVRIEVFNDPEFRPGDNSYFYHYAGEDERYSPTSKHGIKVYQNEVLINSCILTASGGSTGIFENSSLLINDQLVVCCCDTVFSIHIPSLQLNWQQVCDLATCFQVYPLEEDYVIHGELQITRIDNAGHVKWQYGGRDIFVNIDGAHGFKLQEDHILLTDFNGDQYRVDFDGNTI